MFKAGDLVYVPAHVTLMDFDENIDKIDPEKTYVGPSPVRFENLTKPVNLLLLENCESETQEWISVLYNGEKYYINRHDVVPYQEEKWSD